MDAIAIRSGLDASAGSPRQTLRLKILRLSRFREMLSSFAFFLG
jgi:hypothetical protein